MRVTIGLIMMTFTVLAGCGSTQPVPRTIVGRTFALRSLNGQSLPANALFPLRSGCEAAVASSGRLTLNVDGTYTWEVFRQNGGPGGGVAGTYVELQPGALAIFGNSDTARVSGDTLRVTLHRLCQFDNIVTVAEG